MRDELVLANDPKLAMQAAAAKFLQVYFGEEQIANLLLSNYMNKKKSLKLYKDPIFETSKSWKELEPCKNNGNAKTSITPSPGKCHRSTDQQNVCSIDTPSKKWKMKTATLASLNRCEIFMPYLLIPLDNPLKLGSRRLFLKKENTMLVNKLASLKNELSEVRKHTFQSRRDESCVQPSFTSHYDTLMITLQSLKKVEFVDSLSIDIKVEPRADMHKLKLHVSDRYTFTCESALGFEAALMKGVEQAGEFMQAVRVEGREVLIPRSLKFSTTSLVSLLELQTGIPLESVNLSYYLHEDKGHTYGGKILINGITCEYKD